MRVAPKRTIVTGPQIESERRPGDDEGLVAEELQGKPGERRDHGQAPCPSTTRRHLPEQAEDR